QTDKVNGDGRPIWVGSAVYDKRVGLSRTTGQVTHVTAADVDAERDYLFQCLERTGDLAERYVVDGFHKTREGKNGGGDPWRTDGNLYRGVIKPGGPKAGPRHHRNRPRLPPRGTHEFRTDTHRRPHRHS